MNILNSPNSELSQLLAKLTIAGKITVHEMSLLGCPVIRIKTINGVLEATRFNLAEPVSINEQKLITALKFVDQTENCWAYLYLPIP